MKIKIKIDGLTYEVDADDNFSRALEKERADAEQILAQAETAKSEAEARADAAEEKVKILEAAEKLGKAEEAAYALELTKIDALEIAPKLEIQADDTAEQIRRKALEAAGIKIDGKDDAYIAARFDMAREKTETSVDRTRRAVHDNNSVVVEPFSIDLAMRS